MPRCPIICIHPDGHKDYILCVESGSFTITGSIVDFQIGTYDSKRDRIEMGKRLSDLIRTYWDHDELLKELIKSYHNSVHDKNNELAYLYEIRTPFRKSLAARMKQ